MTAEENKIEALWAIYNDDDISTEQLLAIVANAIAEDFNIPFEDANDKLIAWLQKCS